MASSLEQLKKMTVVVADTGDFECKLTILFTLLDNMFYCPAI